LNATDTIERDQLLRNSERPELPVFEQAEKEPGTLLYALQVSANGLPD
jgi:hypothetical protein